MTTLYQTPDGQVHDAEGLDPAKVQQWADKNKAVPVQTDKEMSFSDSVGNLTKTAFQKFGSAVAALPRFMESISTSVDPAARGRARPHAQVTAEREAQPQYKWAMENLPDAPTTRKFASDLFGTETEATHPVGQFYQKAVVPVAIGALTGGTGGLAAMAEGGAAGLTSVAAGEAARALDLPEPVAIGAELLGGGIPTAARMGTRALLNAPAQLRPNPAAEFRGYTEGIEPAVMDNALALQATAQAAGHPILLDEALNLLSNGGAGLLKKIRQIIQSNPGAEGMQAQMAARGPAAEAEVRQLANQLETAPLSLGGPRVPAMTPNEVESLGARVGPGTPQNPGAAKDAMDTAGAWRTRQSADSYAVSDPSLPVQGPADLAGMDELMNSPGMRQAWNAARASTRDLAGPESRIFQMDPLDPNRIAAIRRVFSGQEIDAMKRDMDRIIKKLPLEQSRPIRAARDRLLEYADGISADTGTVRVPRYAQARQESQDALETLQPLNRSPVAAVAGLEGTADEMLATEFRKFFPNSPVVSSPEHAADMIRLLRGDPQSTIYRPGGMNAAPRPGGGSRALRPEGQQLLSKYLTAKLDETIAKTSGGARTGSTWEAAVMGNPAQRQALIAKVRAIDPTVADRLETVARFFQAQGKAPNEGSMTSAASNLTSTLKEASPMVQAIDTGKAVLTGGLSARAGQTALQRAQDAALRVNTRQFVDWLSNPALADQWRQAARLPPNSPQAAALMATLVNALSSASTPPGAEQRKQMIAR